MLAFRGVSAYAQSRQTVTTVLADRRAARYS